MCIRNMFLWRKKINICLETITNVELLLIRFIRQFGILNGLQVDTKSVSKQKYIDYSRLSLA